jgi:pimeloyl-ACP methyl ester carboxylesterase
VPVVTTPAGARVAWDDFGEPSHPPLILIQGFGAQLVGWRPGFCRRLAAEGFHVIRFDNRDVGQSERHAGESYGADAFAEDTVALLDGLGLQSAHIVGQSMGGMIALELVAAHPERVRSLGLVYTTASLAHAKGRDLIDDRMAVAAPSTRDEFLSYYPASEAACASPAYPQDVAWLTEVAGDIWDRGWDLAGPERQLQALLGWAGRVDDLDGIPVPTTILAGDGDQLIDWAASVELHEKIAGSTLTIFPGMGHELPEPLWGEIAGLLGANARGDVAATAVTEVADAAR